MFVNFKFSKQTILAFFISLSMLTACGGGGGSSDNGSSSTNLNPSQGDATNQNIENPSDAPTNNESQNVENPSLNSSPIALSKEYQNKTNLINSKSVTLESYDDVLEVKALYGVVTLNPNQNDLNEVNPTITNTDINNSNMNSNSDNAVTLSLDSLNLNHIKSWTYTLNDEAISNREVSLPIKETFTLTYASGENREVTLDLSNLDPYIKYQWYLYNDGKNYFNYEKAPLKGLDLNVIEAWNEQNSTNDKNLDGEGVVVLVRDYPVDFTHQDLAGQKFDINPYIHTLNDYTLSKTNQNITKDLIEKNVRIPHGTAVSGIIAAQNNGKGTIGISPKAKLVNYDLESSQGYNLLENLPINIYNASYVLRDGTLATSSDEYLIKEIANEKDITIVKSSGNYFESNPLSSFIKNNDRVSLFDYYCNHYNVDCFAGQFDDLERNPQSIVVGAIDAQGSHAQYSSSGSSLWVSAFGGSSKDSDANLTTTFLNLNTDSFYSLSNYKELEKNWGAGLFSENTLYTSKMDGTSAAAPNVTGVIALMKEANPDLTTLQIKYILARTARNDLALTTLSQNPRYVPLNPNVSLLDSIENESGWVNNSAGFRYSNYYGFGLVDAKEAVKLSKSCFEKEECLIRREKPEEFMTSTSSEGNFKCTRHVNNQYVFVYNCVFNGVKGERNLVSSEVEVESLEVDFNAVQFVPEIQFAPNPQDKREEENQYGIENINQDDDLFNRIKNPEARREKDFCNKYRVNDDSSKHDLIDFYRAYSMYQIDVVSPNGTKSIIKPYYAFLMPPKNYSFNLDDSENYVVSQAFYGERFNPDSDSWSINITSMCSLSLERLNSLLKIKVRGYRW